MHRLLLTNIRQLVNVREDTGPLYGKEMSDLPSIGNAWLLIEGNVIADFGKMDSLSEKLPVLPSEQVDCSDKLVMPSWCDSHTHLVFAGSRENEFVDKILGLSYEEINAR